MSIWNPTHEERYQVATMPELTYDPMNQPSMDTMYHAYLKYYEPRETPEGVRWFKKQEGGRMNVTIRRIFNVPDKSTCSVIFIDGVRHSFSVEDAKRDVKVKGQTRIPAGRYKLVLRDSPKFGKPMIYIDGIQNFTDVMFHPGNFVEDTEGCIMPSYTFTIRPAEADRTATSTPAWNDFFARVAPEIVKGEVVCDVFDEAF